MILVEDMKLIRVFIILTSVVAIAFYSLSFIDIMWLAVATITAIFFTRKNTLRNNYAKYLVLFVIWMSVLFMPTFHLVSPIMTVYEIVTPIWDERIISFGAPLFFFMTLILLFIGIKQKNKKVIQASPHPCIFSVSYIRLFILLGIIISMYCYVTGLGRMGGEQIRLPFHLSGIINVFRWTFLPILFAIFVENQLIKGRKPPKDVFVIYFVWIIVDVFAWMSKSIFLYHLLPVLGVLLLYFKPRLKKVIKFSFIIIIPFLFFYPIIGIMRTADRDTSIASSFMEAREQAKDDTDNNILLKPLNRTFMFGAQFVQNSRYINTDDLFDFSNAPLLFLSGGAASFQTFVIDQYPEGAIHSSGTSGLMDPLLHGGIGLMYIIVAILCVFAAFVDKLFLKGYYCIAVILFLRLFELTAMINVSSLYNSTGLQTLFAELICIFMAYKINYGNRSNSSKVLL